MRFKRLICVAAAISCVLCMTACNIEYKSQFTTETTSADAVSESTSQLQTETTETEAQTSVSQETSEETTVSIEERDAWKYADTLTFVDVHQNEYTVDIEPDWPKNDYDKDAFVLDADDLMSYTSDEYTYRLGVDVYEAYSTIDWEAVKASGYEFAIIRLGYRGYVTPSIFRDGMVIDNLVGAINAGLDVGVYFFSQAITEEEAIEEAEFVLKILGDDGFTPEYLKLGVTFDPENVDDEDARTNDVSGEQFTANALAFCETIEEAGYEAVVYSNMLWEAEKFDLEQLKDYTIWYADYEEKPQTPYEFSIWQYGHGKSDGIDGAVDVDIQLIKK